jgi:hypothetical protein
MVFRDGGLLETHELGREWGDSSGFIATIACRFHHGYFRCQAGLKRGRHRVSCSDYLSED